ncbi:MAG: solute carrier family 23 protein [Clostridia bacterium]|nr:solute carrier family 23 protein [Clostridia bacterium]
MTKANQFLKGFTSKDLVLSFQHMFAMLGATILVPILAHMSISMALIAAGVGTVLFYFITKKKVPVFLGSSFAFLPALQSIVGSTAIYTAEWQVAMASVMLSLVLAGLVYVIISLVIKYVGVVKVKKLFPPIVVGPVVIIIGMILAPKMFWNNIIGQSIWTGVAPWKEWTTAIVAALTMVVFNAYAKPKSFLKVIPILLGFAIGYLYAFIISFLPGGSLLSYIINDGTFQSVSLSQAFSTGRIVIFQNIGQEFSFYKGFANPNFGTILLGSIAAIVPIAVVTFMEHLGDISANSTVCGKDFMVDPGLHRTILGDGVATAVSGALGGPANTTYGENTAVLAITKNYNPRNIFVAACLAIFFGMLTVFADFLATIPSAVIGGASIVLFGMISASGLRSLVDGKVDFSNTKNLMVVSITLAVGLGLGAMSLAGDINPTMAETLKIGFNVSGGSFVEISPLAIATVLAIILNIIIPNSKEVTPEQEQALEDSQATLTSSAAIDSKLIARRDAEKAEEAKRIEEEKLAEQTLKEEEAKKAEEAKLAEEKKLAKEAKKTEFAKNETLNTEDKPADKKAPVKKAPAKKAE